VQDRLVGFAGVPGVGHRVTHLVGAHRSLLESWCGRFLTMRG
jgi:hypothetical protein